MGTKVDLTQGLHELDGSPLQTGGACPTCGQVRKPQVLTLRTVLSQAVTAPDREKEIDGEEKLRRWRLGLKFQDRDKIELTSEEVVLLKGLVNRVYPSPVVVGQVWPLLEGETP